MSILTYNFESEYLKNNHEVTVILPDKPRALTPEEFYRSGRKYKVLWLLHGHLRRPHRLGSQNQH